MSFVARRPGGKENQVKGRQPVTASPVQEYSNRLPSSALRYVNLRSMVEIAVLAVGVTAAVVLFVPPAWRLAAWIVLAISVMVGAAVDVPIINRLQVRSTSFEVTHDAVYIRRGILLRRDTIISTAQLLNVTVVDGPLLRRYGLVKVAFATIAHVEPLGPLTADHAEQLRSLALGVARKGDE